MTITFTTTYRDSNNLLATGVADYRHPVHGLPKRFLTIAFSESYGDSNNLPAPGVGDLRHSVYGLQIVPNVPDRSNINPTTPVSNQVVINHNGVPVTTGLTFSQIGSLKVSFQVAFMWYHYKKV